jgi:hypothetical protein
VSLLEDAKHQVPDLIFAFAKECNVPDDQPIIVPSPVPTQFVNVVHAEYTKGNGTLHLQLSEYRQAPVERIGDKPKYAFFEIARFALTPRALRMLVEKAQQAMKDYETAVGVPFPTEAKFLADAALGTISPPPPKGEEPPKPNP